MDLTVIFSVVVGGALSLMGSLAVGGLFYWRASKDLEKKAALLQRNINIVARAMEQQGWVELNYNTNGDVIGMVVTLTEPLVIAGKASIEVSGEVISAQGEEPRDDSNEP